MFYLWENVPLPDCDPVRNSLPFSPFNETEGVVEAFTINASFNTTTGALDSGSFQIDGVVADISNPAIINYTSFGDPGGLLSSNDFDLFGIGAVTDDQAILEFTFKNADGVIADLFGTSGGMIVQINAGTIDGNPLSAGVFSNLGKTFEADYYSVDWSSAVNNAMLISADVFVPVPAALWLFMSGLVALFSLSRNRKPV